jgi:hypothetical protein
MTSLFLRLKVSVFTSFDKSSHADTNEQQKYFVERNFYLWIHPSGYLHIIVVHMQHGDVIETFLSPGGAEIGFSSP